MNPNSSRRGHKRYISVAIAAALCLSTALAGSYVTPAEKVAARYGDTVYLGVGLHSSYGAAQRMYVKRGYVPDGSGAWYGETVCPAYADCRNDDDLVLYLSKKLR